MRSVLAVVFGLCSASCSGASNFRPPLLPELVVAVRPSALLTAPELGLIPGERLIWDVQAKGFSIARAELVVGDEQVTSRVETGVLASAITSLRHELTTTLDREHSRTKSMHEVMVLEGKTTTIDAGFDDKGYQIIGQAPAAIMGVHSLHSALGVLRAWVAPDARAGVLPVLVAGQLFRLEVAQPTLTELGSKSAYRVDARVPAINGAITMWLATTDDHAPMRIEIATPDGKITAELLERTEAK